MKEMEEELKEFCLFKLLESYENEEEEAKDFWFKEFKKLDNKIKWKHF